MQKTIYIETYGCSANQNNSEILAGILTQAGNIITKNPDLADTIIINSCIVKEKTESKIKRRIQDLKQWSKSHKLIIAGCMPKTNAKQLKKLNPYIFLLGTHNFKDINNLIQNKKDILEKNNEIKLNLPKIPNNHLISIHQISEGCLGDCSYCKTKLAKGKLFSYPQEEIIKSIEADLKQGAKEIWLTSQDNASYGLDINKNQKSQLPELLNKILNLKHKFRLRIGMMNPDNVLQILEELITVYKNPKTYKFLHIPIQSASNKVLEHMNRKYTIEQVHKIIKRFQKQFSDITIATDIIVGYPTETEQDHKANLNFIKDYKPSVLNLSKFSSHKETSAGKIKPLKRSIIKQRTTELMKLHRQTAQENKQKFKNQTIEVFINKKIGESLYEARDKNYNIILLKGHKNMFGKSTKIKVKEIGVHHMIAEIIEN